MKQIAAVLLASATLVTASGRAGADPADSAAADPVVTASSPARYSFGVRAGGYGFRNTTHAELGEWDDCRMDGAGVFAQRTLTRYLFAEAGFDLYTARDATPTPEMPAPMDRISGITSVAAGARVPWRWVQPYVQLGVGLEVTRVEMPEEHAAPERALLPMGFLGVGAELFATEHLSIGGNVRTNVMKHFNHGGTHDHAAGDTAMTEMTGEFEAAAQGQLFLKYQI